MLGHDAQCCAQQGWWGTQPQQSSFCTLREGCFSAAGKKTQHPYVGRQKPLMHHDWEAQLDSTRLCPTCPSAGAVKASSHSHFRG